MLHYVKGMGVRALRDRPLLRSRVLRAGALLRSLDRAQPGIYTLCYHRIPAETRASFSAQIGLLRQFGTFIDADTAMVRILSGRAKEERCFLLTFDDGYADNLDVALPVLREHGVPAILFLVSDWLDAPPASADRATGYMTRADVAAWLAAGLKIGSHSASHPRFSTLDEAAAAAELRRSAAILGDVTGRPIRHFACPWGVAEADYKPGRDPLLAQAAGYHTFFTTRRGKARERDDLLAMPRHVLEPEWDLHALRTLLGGNRFAAN